MNENMQNLKDYLSQRPYWKKCWQVISGTIQNITPGEVENTLYSNKEFLKIGLLQYASDDESSSKLEGNLGIKIQHARTEEFKDFLVRLSTYLKVGKEATWKILTSYIMYEYCGSLNNLDKFKYEMHILPMLSNIWKFYTSERMFKLKIIKTCLEFMNVDGHPHATIYRKFINDIGIQVLWDYFVKQYKYLLSEITSDSLDNETPVKLWLERNIREQIEVLQCMIIMVDLVTLSLKKFQMLLKMFKSNGFGAQMCCFEAKKIVEEASIEKLKYTVFALILCIGDEFWSSSNEWAVEQDDEQIDMEMEELVRSQELVPMPVVYVWITMHMVLPNAPDLYNNKYSVWTAKVLNAKVFIYFNQLIRHEMFKDTSIVGVHVREAMYHLVFITIEKFNQDDSFFNYCGALDLSAELLKTRQLTDEFFEQNSNGLMNVWNNTINYFPYKFTNVAKLAEAIITSNSDNIGPVMNEIEHLKIYTIPATEAKMYLNPQKYDYTVFKLNNIPMVKIYKSYNFLYEFIDVVNRALIVGSDLKGAMDKLVSGFKLCLAILKHNPFIVTKYDYFQTIVKQAVNMYVRCYGESEPPIELLSVCLDVLTETMKNYRSELVPKMNNHKLLPSLFKDSFKHSDMFVADSLHLGAIGTLIVMNEKAKDHHLLVISFLKFLRTCLHTNKKDYFVIEYPALIYTLKVIYLHFPVWYGSRESIHKEVLYHIVGIIYEMFQFTESELKDPTRNNMHLLTLYCLLDEPWSRILLQMLVISSNNIQFVMENQTNWYRGKGVKHVTTIQLILSILLQVLQNRKKIENTIGSFPLENFIYSENSNLKVIKAVANLLNHPFNNAIPNLACRLLKKFTVELQTSMLASLELEPDQLRLMFLQRLRDNLESEDLKSAIIELITAGICCQSGMTEAFFTSANVDHGKAEKKDKTSTNKVEKRKIEKVNLNENVGNFMIEYLIQASKDTDNQHSPLLYNIMELFHALWMNQKELLIKDLINDEHFWDSLCNPLFKTIHFENRLYAQILNIITKEIHKCSGKISETLQAVLRKLLSVSERYVEMWLDYIFKDTSDKMCIDDPKPYPSLMGAWKNFNIVIVKLLPADFVETSYKIKVTKKCRLALKHHLMTLAHTEKTIVCAELYLFLMSNWKNLAYLNSHELYEDVIDLLHKLAVSYTTLPNRMKQTILSVAVVCFKNLRSIDSEDYIASNILVESLISIFDHEYSALKISLKSNKLQSFLDRKTHQGYFLCFAILNELINSPDRDIKSDYMIWLNQSILFKNILACAGLLTKNMWTMSLAKDALETLIFYSNLDESVNFLDTELALELWPQFLPSKEYFRPTDLGTVQLVPHNVKNWWIIYKRLVMLLTILLKKHTHFVKKEIVMFISLHEEYIVQILQLVVTSVDLYALDLVLITLNLIYELMAYREFWKLDHEQSYNTIIENVKTTLQCSATLVVRPTVLKYFIINKLNNQTIQSEAVPTKQLIKIMDMMTNIISKSARIILILSPPMLPQVIDNKDYSYWELQLNVNFGIPKWGDCELTTGTLVCLLCLYIRTLQHMALEKKARVSIDKSEVTQVGSSLLNTTKTDKQTKQTNHDIDFNDDIDSAKASSSYSDTVVGFIRLDYLSPFCNLSTVQNFTHSTTVTVFPWHSKLNEAYVITALETILTLLASQIGPLIKYRTYDKLNMRYISRELNSELQIFHDFIRKKLTEMYHFTGKDRSNFVRKTAAIFVQEENKEKRALETLRTWLKSKASKVNVSQQTDIDIPEVETSLTLLWRSGIDYIFTDSSNQDNLSLELMFSKNKDLLQTSSFQDPTTRLALSSTAQSQKLIKSTDSVILHQKLFKSPDSLKRKASKSDSIADSANDENQVKKPEEIPLVLLYSNPFCPESVFESENAKVCIKTKENRKSVITDDYLQFLSNWFMYVLQKDK